jgi:hypothetical protein
MHRPDVATHPAQGISLQQILQAKSCISKLHIPLSSHQPCIVKELLLVMKN